jgi:very-short-patch-repair endonuclease
MTKKIPWNKGKKCEYLIGNKHRLGHVPWNKGLTKKDDHRIGNGKNLVEHVKKYGAWNKGLTGKKFLKHYKNGAEDLARPYQLKGKTYEEIYGEEKSKEQKEKRRIKTKEKYDNGTATFGFPKDGTMKEKRKKQIFPKKDSAPERKVQEYLRLLGYDFYTHQYIESIEHGYQCDISLPVQRRIPIKTIIEVDGDWWHGNPKKYPKLNDNQRLQIEEDKIRTKELLEKGFRVIRIWESEIKELQLEKFSLLVLKGGIK